MAVSSKLLVSFLYFCCLLWAFIEVVRTHPLSKHNDRPAISVPKNYSLKKKDNDSDSDYPFKFPFGETVDKDDVTFLIVGGYRPTVHTLAKHVVSIRAAAGDTFFGANHSCGGSIISLDLILTAAHCFVDKRTGRYDTARDILIVAGSPKRLLKTVHTVIARASRVTPHREFNSDNYLNDIAIIKLIEPLTFEKDYIEPIPFARKRPAINTVCTTVGWGRIFHKGPIADDLMYVDILVWGFRECRAAIPLVFSSMICAGDKTDAEKDACAGDSGGPLFCDGILAGIVSFGIGCASPGYPGIYTDIASFVHWIARNHAIAGSSYGFLYFVIIFWSFDLNY